jgi:hypothetical protein
MAPVVLHTIGGPNGRRVAGSEISWNEQLELIRVSTTAGFTVNSSGGFSTTVPGGATTGTV